MQEREETSIGLDLHVRAIVGFFVRFMVLFVLLAAPWPGLPKIYAPVYRYVGNALFARFGSGGAVRLRPSTGQDPERDTEFVLTNRSNGSEYTFVGTSLKGYQPMALVMALIAATPIPWSRRWRALLWGLACVTLYAILRMVVFLVFSFSADNALALYTLSPTSRTVLDYVYWVVVESLAGWLILPLPIWAIVCFGQRDWLTSVLDRKTSKHRE